MASHRIVGVLGGTGPAGTGLAVRLAAAGHHVLVGSRDADRARSTVAELQAAHPGRLEGLEGLANADAVAKADGLVVVATAAEHTVSTAESFRPGLEGQVVVSMANLLTRTARGFAAIIPEHGSVACMLAETVPGARVVGAYQNLPAAALGALDEPLDAEVIVCGDDAGAVAEVMALTDSMEGLQAVDGGPLINSVGVEAMTAVLLTVNRQRRIEHGIRLVDLHRRATRE